MNRNSGELAHLLKNVFPAGPSPQPVVPFDHDRIEDDDELQQLIADFTGKSWDSIPQNSILRNAEGLWLLTDDAFRYFVPGFLTFLLENMSRVDAVEMILYGLFLRDDRLELSRSRLARMEKLTAEQRNIVIECLTYLRDKSRESGIVKLTTEIINDWGKAGLLH